MAFLGEAIARLILDSRGFSRGLDTAERGLFRFQSQTQTVGFGLQQLGTTLTAAGAAIGVSLVAAVKVAADFEEAMRNVAAISPEVAESFDQFADGVIRISTETARMPKDLAEGLYNIISAAIPASQALDVLEASAKAANAGLTTVGTSSKVLAAILNSGIKDLEGNAIDLAKAMDISFQAVNKGVFTFEEWATQIGDTLPLAAALGVSLEEVAAAAATLTQNGVSLAETTTQINAVLTALLKPTDDVTAVFNEMGYETGLALIRAEGFTGALVAINEHLEKTGDNSSDFSKNIRAIRGLLGLTNDEMVRYNENLKAMENATGATDAALKQQGKTLNFALRELRANLAALGVSVGTIFLPAITAFTKALTALTRAINALPRPVKAALSALASLAAVSLLVSGAFALFQGRFLSIAAALSLLRREGFRVVTPFSVLRVALFGLLNPLSLVAGALRLILIPLSAFGVGLIGLLSPLRLVSGLLRVLISPISLIVTAFRILGVGLIAFRVALGGALPLVARMRIGLLGIKIVALGLISPFRTIVSLIVGISAVIGSVVGALATFTAAIVGVAVAFVAWRLIRDDVKSVVDQIRELLELEDDILDFFGFEAETKHVKENSEALRENRHALRDRIAEALGIETKHISPFAKDTVVPFLSGGGVVEGARKGDVKQLKALDKALKGAGREVRAWRNKFAIGGRAVSDFFDIIGGAGGRDQLKTFRARLNDVFGRDAGGDIYESTKRMRDGIKLLNDELSKRLGIDNVLSLQGAVLLALDAFTRFSEFARTSIVPVLGNIIATVLDLGAAFLDLAANIVQGDFGGMVDAIEDIVGIVVGDVVIPIGEITLAVGGWVIQGAIDLYERLKRWVYGSITGSTSAQGSTNAGAMGGSVAQTPVSVPLDEVIIVIGGWAIRQAKDLFSAIRAKILGWVYGGDSGDMLSGPGGTSNEMTVGQGAHHDLSDVAVMILGWVITQAKSLASAISDTVRESWPSVKSLVQSTVNTLGDIAVQIPGWIVTQAKSLAAAVSDVARNAWPSVKSIAQSTIDGLGGIAVVIKNWLVSDEEGKGSLISRVGEFVRTVMGSSVTVPIGDDWSITFVGLAEAFKRGVKAAISSGTITAAINEALVVTGPTTTMPFLSGGSTTSGSPLFDLGKSHGESAGKIVGEAFGVGIAIGIRLAVKGIGKLLGSEQGSADGKTTGEAVGAYAEGFATGFVPAFFGEVFKQMLLTAIEFDTGDKVKLLFAILDRLMGETIKGTIDPFSDALKELRKHLTGEGSFIDDVRGAFNETKRFIEDIDIPAINWGDIWSRIFGTKTTTTFSGKDAAVVGAMGVSPTVTSEVVGVFDKAVDDLRNHLTGEGSFVDDIRELLDETLRSIENIELPSINWGDVWNRLFGTKVTTTFGGAEAAVVGAMGIPPTTTGGTGGVFDGVLTELRNHLLGDGSFIDDVRGVINEAVDAVENIEITPIDWSSIWTKLFGSTTTTTFSGSAATNIGAMGVGPVVTSQIRGVVTGFISGLVAEIRGADFSSVGTAIGDMFNAITGFDFATLGTNIANSIISAISDAIVPDWAQGVVDKISRLLNETEPSPIIYDSEGNPVSGSSNPTTGEGDPDAVKQDDVGGEPEPPLEVEQPFKITPTGPNGEPIKSYVFKVMAEKIKEGTGDGTGGGESTELDIPITFPPEKITEATTWATQITQAVFTVLQGFLPTATAIGGETGNNYSQGVLGKLADVTSAAMSLTQGIFDVFRTFLPTGTAMGAELGDNYASGLRGMAGAAYSAASGVSGSAVFGLGGGYGAAFSAGQSVGQGFVSGIQSFAQAAYQAGVQLGNAASNGTADANQSDSPSKVFIRLGQFVGQGYALGIESAAQLIERAGRQMALSSVPSIPGIAPKPIPSAGKREYPSSTVSFHGATFVVPNMDTAAAIESYFLTLSRSSR